MRVSELQVGKLYKIRSDRPTHVLIRNGWLDVHLGGGAFRNEPDQTVKIRPFDYIVYLGDFGYGRVVIYRGQRIKAYSNIWRHIVPVESDEESS